MTKIKLHNQKNHDNLSNSIDLINEEHFIKNNTLFKLLVELSPDPIAIHKDNVFVYVNDACVDLVKAKSKNDIIGKLITNIIHSDNHKELLLRTKKAIRTNSIMPITEMQFICFDGSIKIAEVTSRAIKIGNNNYILAIAHDISNRKKALEELVKNEEKYRNIFEQSRECIYLTRPDGSIIDINGTGCKILGRTKEELKDINVYDLYVDPKQRKEAIKILETNGFIKDVEILLKRKDKTNIICLDTAVTWRDINGQTIGYIGILQDITQKKKIETEKEKLISDLKKSKEALEKETLKVKKLNSNLLDSQNELKEHIATKDKFFSIISHDLRGPISAFLNLTDLLLSEMEEMSWKELKETMKMMHSSALGVNRLLNNLLQWSRLQRGKLDFTPANYNLKFIIDNGIDILKSSARDKSINIINLVADDIIVYADSNMLDLVIRNLISNSIKFTNEGGTITISSSKKNKKLIIVSITDTGIGIEPKNLEKLFRIDEKITTEGTKGELGSGLGLILCKEFVEKNGGKISVKSSIGKGTTFTFSIPSGA